MKKLLTLFFAILCNCHLYSQLPSIPIPVPGTIDTYGININQQAQPHLPTPFIKRGPTNPVYDPNELTRRNQRAQQEINEAIRLMREIEERKSIAHSLSRDGFPSQASIPGTEYFRSAYQEIYSMLRDSIPLNLERAVFLIENAFLGNQLNYDNFQKSIQERVDYCKWRMQQLKLDPHDGLAQNMAIFSLLTDTLNIKQPGSEKTITHYPLKYNLNDYDSQKDFTSHFVTTLLATNVGQCHSMPLLYLILAERLGTKAYLSMAPQHSFVKIQDDNGAWYNLELTCRSVLSDYHYMNSSYIKSEAIRNKLYMTPLSKKETVASMLTLLGQYYLMKYGYDPFILDCIHTAELFAPYDIYSKIMEADYETRLTLEIARLLNIRNPEILKKVSPEAYKHYERMHELYKEIDDSGYEKMPKEIYARWLRHVDKLKKEESKNHQPIFRKTVK